MAAICECIASQYSRPKGVWGAIAGGFMAFRPSHREQSFQTLDALELGADDAVLEIGFGPGVGIGRALELAPRGIVAGVDPSAVMLRQALRRNQRWRKNERLDLRRATVESLPDFGRSFDRIFAINSIGFWNEPISSLATLRQKLSPTGKLAVTFEPRPGKTGAASVGRAADRLARWFERAGLSDIRTRVLELSPGPAACVIGSR